MDKSMSRIFLDDAFKGLDYIGSAYGEFVNTVITSPPYAEQRKNQYGGVTEEDYPQWTVDWMRKIKKVLREDGSVFINIRPHIKNGVISDYVLKTRLALRADGWKECEELIWYKPDSPPLGSIHRPRRAYEHILWFSKTGRPFCNPKANGVQSTRIGFESNKFEHGGKSHIHSGQNEATSGTARSTDVIVAGTSSVEAGIKHPAMFPKEIPDHLIKLTNKKDMFVLDPFIGSGTTARACIDNNVGFVGFESQQEYYYDAEKYTAQYITDNNKTNLYSDFIKTYQKCRVL